MTENDITIINTSYHKNLTDRHLAQINFTAIIPFELWRKYADQTSIEKQSLKRIRFMMTNDNPYTMDVASQGDYVPVFGRVSHGYGYDITQDIFNSIEG